MSLYDLNEFETSLVQISLNLKVNIFKLKFEFKL